MNDFELIDSQERSIGLLYLTRYERPQAPGGWVYDVHIDGHLLMSSISPLSERELATRGLAAHRGGGELSVLIGGMGLGYTAQAALESDRPSRVRVVDPMDFVFDWMRKGLLPLSEQLNADQRLELHQSDVYADLLGPPDQLWDLILVDVDHSPEMPLDRASLPFYTPEGQAAVRRHLAPGGVLAVWSAHDNDAFAAVLDQVYATAWREEIAWVVSHEDAEDDELHNVLFIACTEPTPELG